MANKELTGVVVGDSTDNTRTIIVNRMIKHPRFKKIIMEKKRYVVLDSLFKSRVGDIVRIRTCSPISKKKNWLIVNIIKKFVR